MSTEKICRFLDELNLKDCKIRILNGGYVSNTFLIEFPSKKMVLKEYIGSRTLEQISGEIEFLDFLSSKNFPVPIPQKIDNKFIHTFEGSVMVFSRYMPGSTITADELNQENITNTLEVLSKIHKSSEGLKLENLKKRRDMFTFDFEDWVDTYIEKEIPSFFKETIILKNLLKERLESKIDYFDIFPIHNDLVLQNLKFGEGKLCAILDFDDFCEGTRMSDLSNFTLDICILKNGLDLERLKYCLFKYDSLQNLTEDEIKIFPLIFIHRLIMYIYFMYYNFLSKNNNKSLREAERYYSILKNLIGKEILYKDKKIKFKI